MSTRLRLAVDAITKPTERRIHRDQTQLTAELAQPRWGICRITDHAALTLTHGKIPSLWEEANYAIYGSEAGDGSGGRSPLRERTPADLDLMETLLTIRESLGWQLPGRGIPWRKPGNIPNMMRQLAAHLTTWEPQYTDWWAFRFEQWARLLRTHLNAVEQGPRTVHLRGATCPNCGATHIIVTTDQDGRRTTQPATEFRRDSELKVEPALTIDFVNGWIRAAECQACGHAWFRGDDLGQLADKLA